MERLQSFNLLQPITVQPNAFAICVHLQVLDSFKSSEMQIQLFIELRSFIPIVLNARILDLLRGHLWHACDNMISFWRSRRWEWYRGCLIAHTGKEWRSYRKNEVSNLTLNSEFSVAPCLVLSCLPFLDSCPRWRKKEVKCLLFFFLLPTHLLTLYSYYY